jgi:hypothetical protein
VVTYGKIFVNIHIGCMYIYKNMPEACEVDTCRLHVYLQKYAGSLSGGHMSAARIFTKNLLDNFISAAWKLTGSYPMNKYRLHGSLRRVVE